MTTRRVLVVEDDAAWAELTQEAIHEVAPDVAVDIVRGGDEAIAVLTAGTHPDLVLLDLNMPGTDGRDVLRALRSTTPTDPPRVVVLSASIAPRDRELAEELGATAFTTKPLTFTGLCDLARELLG